MPLFEIRAEGLVQFRRVGVGPELYEREIEALLWENLEDFTGTALFPVARQPHIAGGGRPDIVALDETAHVVVIEVKRDVDRGQLAQCLEYAGWARTTSLDELANFYHGGSSAFFSAWQEFTQTDSPLLLQRPPRLALVARDFHDRTESALDFLTENHLPISVLRATVYVDQQARRFIDVTGATEPPVTGNTTDGEAPATGHNQFLMNGQRITVSDLLEAHFLASGDALVWDRPRLGQHHEARVTDTGELELSDGRLCATPSRAAKDAASIPAYDGWHAWRAPTRGGKSLADLRRALIASQTSAETMPEPAGLP